MTCQIHVTLCYERDAHLSVYNVGVLRLHSGSGKTNKWKLPYQQDMSGVLHAKVDLDCNILWSWILSRKTSGVWKHGVLLFSGNSICLTAHMSCYLSIYCTSCIFLGQSISIAMLFGDFWSMYNGTCLIWSKHLFLAVIIFAVLITFKCNIWLLCIRHNKPSYNVLWLASSDIHHLIICNPLYIWSKSEWISNTSFNSDVWLINHLDKVTAVEI